MNDLKITLHHGTAAPQDVTEAVQIIYDALYHSMDAGSGFLDTEEQDALRHLASVAGFEPPRFMDDRCKCGHVSGMHSSTADGECLATTVVTEPEYRREQRQTLQPAPLPKEEFDRTQQAIVNAQTEDEVRMILAEVVTKYDLVMHEVTVMVKEGERTRCDCPGWEYAP